MSGCIGKLNNSDSVGEISTTQYGSWLRATTLVSSPTSSGTNSSYGSSSGKLMINLSKHGSEEQQNMGSLNMKETEDIENVQSIKVQDSGSEGKLKSSEEIPLLIIDIQNNS